MKYLNWLTNESPWIIRWAPVTIVFVAVVCLFFLSRLFLTETQWNRFDRYMRGAK